MPFTEHAEELLEKVREFGLEGLVGKRAGSRYEPGRRSRRHKPAEVIRENHWADPSANEKRNAAW